MQYSRAFRAAFAALLIAASGCSRAREYELRGQVLLVDPARQELTIKHEDIRGFMPGMTMPFKVKDGAAFAARKPGELIRATLVVEDSEGYLKNITSTGQAPLTEPPPRPRVDVLEPGQQVPDTVFVDEAGRSRTFADWRGQAVAVTFIYTRCPIPDFCPLVDKRFGEVQRLLAKDPALAARAHLVSMTLDPAFDLPSVLAAHGKKVGADPAVWTFMTGDRADVETFAATFGVSIVLEKDAAPQIVHNLRTAVIDGSGRLSRILSGTEWTAETLVDAMRSAGADR